ncbi:hypothetical protein M6B38_254430 [Iris pallida]|uniref:Secreted protein n=1 Tax=Iris pallida TaxID=29817 RepID=A0AAX6IIH7_IRIPA|nr:hypothetical protein M6B38_254430 [Iris pallida]
MAGRTSSIKIILCSVPWWAKIARGFFLLPGFSSHPSCCLLLVWFASPIEAIISANATTNQRNQNQRGGLQPTNEGNQNQRYPREI